MHSDKAAQNNINSALGCRRALAIVSALLSLILLAYPLPSSAIEQKHTLSRIEQYLQQAVPQLGAPGVAVALVHEGDIVYSNVWGSTSDGTPVTLDTPFLIGSISKPVTALAIRQLVMDGAVDLNAPISLYLPDFRTIGPDGKPAQIRVRDLLGHTSGFGTSSGLRVADLGIQGENALNHAVELLRGEALAATPGERHIYSDANYLLLGALITQRTGRSFADHIQASVFDPIGMQNAAASFSRSNENGWQSGYRSWFGHSVRSRVPFDDAGASYGYMTASITDLGLFAAELMQPAVLSHKTVEGLFEPLSRFGRDMDYGWGWRMGQLEGEEPYIWHAGSNADFRAELAMLPERDWAIAILANRNNVLEEERMTRLAMDIARILRGKSVEPPEFSASPVRWLTASLAAILTLITLGLAWRAGPKAPRVRKRWLAWIFSGLLLAAAVLLVPVMNAAFGVTWRTSNLFAPDVTAATVLISVLLATMGLLTAWLARPGR